MKSAKCYEVEVGSGFKPGTLSAQTSNSKPHTLNPKLRTPNPKPQTLRDIICFRFIFHAGVHFLRIVICHLVLRGGFHKHFKLAVA